MSTSTPTHDNTVLLVTYNHWLKSAYPKNMDALNKLGLRVEFRTVDDKDTRINPTVFLTIAKKKTGEPLYTWNGECSMGGVDKVPAMAKSFWEGMPPMLAMLRARHIYMTMVTTDLPQDVLDMALCKGQTKKQPNWVFGTDMQYQDVCQMVDDRGLNLLKDVYEKGSKPDLHLMVGTKAVIQIAKVSPLVATAASVTGNDKAVGDKDDLEVTVGVVPDGLSFTLKDYWMELSYGWESAGLVAVMSWQALKNTFGLDETKFNIHYNMNGGDAKDALYQSLQTVPDTPTNELPQGFDQP
jgi:hypothetical protein